MQIDEGKGWDIVTITQLKGFLQKLLIIDFSDRGFKEEMCHILDL
jgi:hypothetical protein